MVCTAICIYCNCLQLGNRMFLWLSPVQTADICNNLALICWMKIYWPRILNLNIFHLLSPLLLKAFHELYAILDCGFSYLLKKIQKPLIVIYACLQSKNALCLLNWKKYLKSHAVYCQVLVDLGQPFLSWCPQVALELFCSHVPISFLLQWLSKILDYFAVVRFHLKNLSQLSDLNKQWTIGVQPSGHLGYFGNMDYSDSVETSVFSELRCLQMFYYPCD